LPKILNSINAIGLVTVRRYSKFMLKLQPLQALLTNTHGSVIAAATERMRLRKGRQDDGQLSKREQAELRALISTSERSAIIDGVDFSCIQVSAVLWQRDNGIPIEFETLGPYVANYIASDGRMSLSNLTAEDAVGLELAKVFRKIFPRARLVSLYDDYNAGTGSDAQESVLAAFSKKTVRNFKASLVKLFKAAGAISAKAEEGKDFFLISETSKMADAERLTEVLESMGKIERTGNEVIFVNDDAENPLYRKFHLRSKNGKWLCPVLDAAGFLSEENRSICHIVVLPEYMKSQQDKVWELLRTFKMSPLQYHNIFYDPKQTPAQVTNTIERQFNTALSL
jgi:hypothetical protein